MMVMIREAIQQDLVSILNIYNQGIVDKIATLESEPKNLSYMEEWFEQHKGRFKVIVAESEGQIIGWCSLNPYNNRCAYAGVADLSVYVDRANRGKGVGGMLLTAIENYAKADNFHKIVLFTFPFNKQGKGLYHKIGYREVGVFQNQGILDENYVDIMAMEKLLDK